MDQEAFEALRDRMTREQPARIVLEKLKTITGIESWQSIVASASLATWMYVHDVPEVRALGTWRRLVDRTLDGPRDGAVCVVDGPLTDEQIQAGEAIITAAWRKAKK